MSVLKIAVLPMSAASTDVNGELTIRATGRVITAALVFVQGPDGAVTFVRQERGPYAGWWLLPGGKVEFGEPVAAVAGRKAVRLSRMLRGSRHKAAVAKEPIHGPCDYRPDVLANIFGHRREAWDGRITIITAALLRCLDVEVTGDLDDPAVHRDHPGGGIDLPDGQGSQPPQPDVGGNTGHDLAAATG